LSNSEQAGGYHVILLLHSLSEPSVEKYISTANSERSETTLLRNVKFVKRNTIYEFENQLNDQLMFYSIFFHHCEEY
jgi:hypothetical protein